MILGFSLGNLSENHFSSITELPMTLSGHKSHDISSRSCRYLIIWLCLFTGVHQRVAYCPLFLTMYPGFRLTSIFMRHWGRRKFMRQSWTMCLNGVDHCDVRWLCSSLYTRENSHEVSVILHNAITYFHRCWYIPENLWVAYRSKIHFWDRERQSHRPSGADLLAQFSPIPRSQMGSIGEKFSAHCRHRHESEL